ncbi:copper resistance system multicopper oxidase [Ketobacter nezhaii]|uniref:copper resistance system multicopper oxidase n=1 Tax=Ketobacter sp. MCCC 1A13808 TaxID=2602738 RepID=UPI001E477FFF|nr:copper resistance system multicopper oxidase [Ketobacter sp. MCCC 1A13808]
MNMNLPSSEWLRNGKGLSRRQFVTGVSAGAAALGLGFNPLMATAAKATPLLRGNHFDLNIGYQSVNFTGTEGIATTVNGALPAPILRWQEGERVTLRVTNQLAHDSSIHWHGMILPSNMDGVPGMSFDGIKPGATFEYQFDVKQSGTYWYHSHSGFQEQTGLYGAIVIDPKQADPVSYDREHVIVISDWSDTSPHRIYRTLKKMSHYYNFRERTAADVWRDIKEKGVAKTWNERAMWNRMRMSDTDISDVTGYTYTFLMNGLTPEQNWQGQYKKGEKVRLRIINAAAMTIFDFRIPGLKMKVVASDGQNIDPVTVDEFRIGVAETYDVVVEPEGDNAYSLFAQSMDRSGFSCGTLSADSTMKAAVPAMDEAPVLGHQDMGMAHHSGHEMGEMDHHSGDHMEHVNIASAGFGSSSSIVHSNTEFGPHVDMRASMPVSGLRDPGVGLRDHMKRYGRKVLTYYDLCNYYPTQDKRDPQREIQLHLTGNMSRYMWSINGTNFADAEPLQLKYGERIRIILVNDTMMTHPIHLHGMWSELETEDANYIPKKHTLLVQPGSTISYLVNVDARGRWAYHCHLLYHMPGMMREVNVV